MKNKKPKSKINKWKLTAIISLVVNGLVALLLTIGLATPKSYVKASADFEYSYDTSKIITSPNSIRSDTDYYLYFDWKNQDVDGDGNLFYFPLSNSVPIFSYGINITPTIFNDFRYTTLQIYKPETTSDIIIGGYGRVVSTNQAQSRIFGRVRYQIEPPSMFLEFDNSYSQEENDFIKSLFNGSILLGANTPNFVKGYFSQYSVQNIQVGVYEDSDNRLKKIDFEALYSFDRPLRHNSYKFLANNLIVTTNQQRLFGEDEDLDLGYMNALDGIFRYSVGYDNSYCSSLYFVWKPIEVYQLQNFSSVIIDGFIITSGVSNNYYYYLDSLCPYDVANEEILVDSPLAIFHTDTISTSDPQPPFTSETTSILRMTSGVYLQNPILTILKVNLFPSQSQKWAMFGYLFRIINHFYFNSGSPIITEPYQTDIENSTNNINGVFALIKGAFESLIPVLSISILPNITIGVLVFIPLVLTIIIVVIKLVKR